MVKEMMTRKTAVKPNIQEMAMLKEYFASIFEAAVLSLS